MQPGDEPTEPAKKGTANPRSVTMTAESETSAGDWTPGRAEPVLPARDPGRYEVIGEAGRGGIGRVMRARDRELDRVVAVKELVDEEGGSEARFLREIRLTARLEHPGIVPVHDAGRWATDGRSFYTMKLVAGASLKEVVVRAGTLEERLALTPHLLAIAEAVAYAHGQGVIHRDLKPSNVIIGEYGETIVIDWGLAKAFGEAEISSDGTRVASGSDVTAAGAILGTPVFMAPEQARGAPVDWRADVYALGAIGYFMVTGRAPYEGNSSAAVLKRVAADPPVPLREREAGVPVDLAAILEKAMARDPADRYPTARELAVDLRRYQAGRFVSARAYAWWEGPARWLRRHWVIAALTAAFVLVGIAGAAVGFAREQGLRRTAERERARADVQALALLEQQGRRELEVGRPSRAAPLLVEALARAPGRRALRALVSEALAPIATRRATLRGHERDVVCAAFSPDGQRVATGSTDLTVRIWDVATGRLERVLRGAERSLEDVAWSPDGSRVAGSDFRGVHVWQVADGQLLHGFEGGAFRLAFAPDSRALWAGGGDGTVRVWDAVAGTALASRKVHDDRVSALMMLDGGRVATTSWDGRIHVWDAAAMTPTSTIDDHHAPVWIGAVSDDRTRLVTGDEDGALLIRDAATLAVQHVLRLPGASHATSAWLSGLRLVTVSADGGVRVWDAPSGRVLRTIDAVAEGKLFDGARSPDGRLVATAGLRTVDLWEVDRDAPYRIFAGGDFAHADLQAGALSADGRRLAVARVVRDRPSEMRIWDTASGALIARWDEAGVPYSIAISRDGGRLVVGDVDGNNARIRGGDGALIAELRGHQGKVYNVALSADEQWIATAGFDRSVRLWRASDGGAVGAIALEVRPSAVGFSPDAAQLAIAGEDGSVRLVDRGRLSVIRTFPAHATWIQDVEYAPDGRRLVTAGRQDHTVKIWDLAGGAAPIALLGHADNVIRASFSPDGRTVATASMDDTARLWDAASGELLRTLEGPTQTAAFGPDGATLYTTGSRDFVAAWRLDVDERPVRALAEAVATWSPWVLVDGRLRLRAPVGPTP